MKRLSSDVSTWPPSDPSNGNFYQRQPRSSTSPDKAPVHQARRSRPLPRSPNPAIHRKTSHISLHPTADAAQFLQLDKHPRHHHAKSTSHIGCSLAALQIGHSFTRTKHGTNTQRRKAAAARTPSRNSLAPRRAANELGVIRRVCARWISSFNADDEVKNNGCSASPHLCLDLTRLWRGNATAHAYRIFGGVGYESLGRRAEVLWTTASRQWLRRGMQLLPGRWLVHLGRGLDRWWVPRRVR
jgi:hypothetical protein